MGEFAIAPAGAVVDAAGSETVILDSVSSSANRLEMYRQDIADGREVALDFITDIQFKDSSDAKVDAFGSIEKSDATSAELLGQDPNAGEAAADPRTEQVMTTLKDLYVATAKTAIAWKVVEGVGKDTKAMLQTQ
ncbi:MAG: hypothetical protein AAFN94_17675 [Pseudomonadota bacterium]